MDKREAVLSLLDPKGPQTAIPAAFFMHFDRAFHTGTAAVDKHEEFFRFTGMDLVKIQFELPFPSLPARSPEDWKELPCLPLDHYTPHLEVVKGLVDRLGREALVVLTLYSPYMIAGQMGGEDALVSHLKQDPEPVAAGLKNVTDSLERFCAECVHLGLDGFYHSTQGGEDRRFAGTSLFEDFVKPTDLRIMRELDRTCRFNILHICDYNRETYGGYSDLSKFLDYPGHVVNANPEGMPIREVSSLFARPFMGGMRRKGALANGTEEDVRSEARQVLEQRPARFFLAAECTIPGGSSWSNLRAAIEEAHRIKG